MAQGSPAGLLGAAAEGVGGGAGGPKAPAWLPGAMSHEPLTIKNRLINELFDYLL